MDCSCKLDVMDRQVRGYYGPRNQIKLSDDALLCLSDRNLVNGTKLDPMNQIKLNDGNFSSLSDQNLVNGAKLDDRFVDQNLVDLPVLPSDPSHSNFTPFYGENPKGDHHEDYDFSDVVLGYINQMLMEEDMEEKTCMFQESAALLAAEKSFYDVLGEKYPPPHEEQPMSYSDQSGESLDENHVDTHSNYSGNDTHNGSFLASDCICDPGVYKFPNAQSGSIDLDSPTRPQSCLSSLTSSSCVTEGPADSPVSTLGFVEIFNDSQSAMLMKRGFDEASKFLPNGNGFLVNIGKNGFLVKDEKKDMVVKVEEKHENEQSPDGSRGKKNPYPEDDDLEGGRSNKHSALFSESTVRSEMFDMVLLCSGGKNDSALRESLQTGASKGTQQEGKKARGKKQGGKKDVVDLRTLLTLCAQAVAVNDQRNANELLKQIRQHSSPTGDGMQRLAHYFACGLEARMAGTGSMLYDSLIMFPPSAADVLKAYHLMLATSPFRKMSNFFANKTIITIAENATSLHIIDFGILYGFQWPCLIQRLSSRPGGPPKLRITGIDFPIPGFRPSQRVEETGRRLANYAETFGVPFEFNAIAQKWETIQIDDLKIERDEMLVVNCLFRFKNLLDETVVVESPRNTVMHMIRKTKPDIFIQGVVNGSYNAPFFITRFREALFHYSSLFDMIEANVPREIHERMLVEKMIFGQEAMNVIACEGAERIERPETYKQWQVRNLRAGFRPLPLDKEIMSMAKDRVKSSYHKDFVIDEDGQWMLQGWKGRIIYALSSWRPVY